MNLFIEIPPRRLKKTIRHFFSFCVFIFYALIEIHTRLSDICSKDIVLFFSIYIHTFTTYPYTQTQNSHTHNRHIDPTQSPLYDFQIYINKKQQKLNLVKKIIRSENAQRNREKKKKINRMRITMIELKWGRQNLFLTVSHWLRNDKQIKQNIIATSDTLFKERIVKTRKYR